MGKLQPIEALIERAKSDRLVRCAVCQRLYDREDAKQAFAHAACKPNGRA